VKSLNAGIVSVIHHRQNPWELQDIREGNRNGKLLRSGQKATLRTESYVPSQILFESEGYVT
jgi:hypothetical protein